ncbi:MAG: alpha/beta fold hydrolase, partial [Firmicutes bacterium]|nr:alpha/beta fold hydrolase [Bacillota bacterium]
MGMETWVELSNYGETIRGTLHRPVGAGPHPAVLFLHGLGGNRIEANRLFVRAARILAKQGIAALRIDFRGAGESDGEAEARSVSGHLSDALTAYHFLAEDAQLDRHRLAVLGFSLGGAVAALLAGELAGSDLPE